MVYVCLQEACGSTFAVIEKCQITEMASVKNTIQ